MRGRLAKQIRSTVARHYQGGSAAPQELLGDNRTVRYYFLVSEEITLPGGVVSKSSRIVKSEHAQLPEHPGQHVTALFATYTMCYHPNSRRRQVKQVKRMVLNHRRGIAA